MFTQPRLLWVAILLQYGANWIEGNSHEKESTNPSTFFAYATQMSYESQLDTVLRVYAANVPPIISVIGDPKSKRVKITGLAIDFAEYIAQHLNLTIEYVMENPIEVEKYDRVQAAENALFNREVDLILNGMTPSPERVEKFDLTSPIMYNDYKIMVKWPDEMGRWTEVARPFDIPTWSMVAVTMIFMIGMTTLLALFIYERYNRELIMQTVGENTMYVIGIMINQGDSETTRRLSLRILLGCWLLMMVVLINAYTGTLTSHLTVPKLKPIPQSLEELADMSQDYHITIRDNYLLSHSILNSSSRTFKIFGDFLRENPNYIYKQFSDVTDIVLNQKGANVEQSAVIAFRIARDYKLNGKCRMTASNPISQVQAFSAALSKNSPFTKTFEKEMQRAREAGFTNFWSQKYLPSMDRCKLENQDQGGKPTPITLAQLSSAFAVLLIGISLALFAFLFEIIFSSLKKLKSKQRSLNNRPRLSYVFVF